MFFYKIIETGMHILVGYTMWLFDLLRRKSSKTSIYRYSICKKCEHNIHGICEICGCILKAKVRVDYDLDENGKSIDGCPEKKW